MPNDTRTTKLPKVSSYVKNVGKSVGYAAVKSLELNAPSIKEFMDSNNEIFKNIYSGVRNYRQTFKDAEKTFRQTNLYKTIDLGLKNLVEDAKTGKFYNDRAQTDEEYQNAILGMDSDDDDYSFSVESSSSSSKSSEAKMITGSFDNAIGAAAISNNTAIAEGTNLVIRSSRANAKLMMGKLDFMTAKLNAGMGTVYTEIGKTNQFLNGPLMNHLENSRKYYEETTKIMRDNSMMLKELLEMQRNLYKQKRSSYKESNLDSSLLNHGGLNITGYGRNIKKNMKDLADLYSGGLASGFGGINPFMAFAAYPFQFLMDGMTNRILPKDFKKALRSFDKGVMSIFPQLISRLNFERDKGSGVLQFLGELFGIKLNRKEKINPANYNKGAVAFDGITRQAIIETIPGYLSRIEAKLTGMEERHYDYQSGSWKSASQIQREFSDKELRNIASANSDLKRTLSNLAQESQLKAEKLLKEAENKSKKIQDEASRKAKELMQEAKDIKSSYENLMKTIYKDGGNFNPNMGKRVDKDGLQIGEDAWKHYGAKDEKTFLKLYNELKKNPYILRDLAQNNMIAIESYARNMKREEENGGISRILFNGTYDITGKGNGSKNLPSDFTGKGFNLLRDTRDISGNNIFYYLKGIFESVKRAPNTRRSTGSTTTKGRERNKSKSRNTTSSSSSSSSTDDDGGRPDPEDESDLDRAERLNNEERNEKNAKQDDAKQKIKFFSSKMTELFGDNKIIRAIGRVMDGAANIVSAPMNYMTKMLQKADENLFQMMFGEKSYKDDKGNDITNLFSYMMYRVKKSFESLTDEIKKKIIAPIKDRIKGFIDNINKNGFLTSVKDELKGMYTKAKNRVSKSLHRTIIDPISERLKNGGVVDHNDINNAQESARGRYVTKRGLTMISPGEMIIPASFDKKEQNKMLNLEKKEKSKILKSISFNAAGTVDTDQLKDNLRQIYEDNKGKGAKNVAHGVVGAGVGLLTGINPLLGAMAGAGLSILSNNDKFQKFIFGEDINGEHKGGLIPKKLQDYYKKVKTDVTDFGITGGILGLVTPFGPLGGAVIGASVGLLKNSENFKKFVFGENGDGKGGIMSKKTYEKFKNMVFRAVPNMAVGAVGGALLGPFGLLGNAVMGAGLGLFSTTDAFHKLIFGHGKDEKQDPKKPRKGLLGAVERGIIDPAKEKLKGILENLQNYTKKHILEPMKRFWDPFKQMLKNIVSNVANAIKDSVDSIFEKTIGIPLSDFLQQKVFKPLTKLFFNVLKLPINMIKAPISAVTHSLGWVGDNIRAAQIRKGTAYDTTAQERMDFEDKHPIRGGLNRFFNLDNEMKYGITARKRDEMIAGMNNEQISSIKANIEGQLKSFGELQKNRGNARNDVGNAVSEFFNTKDDDGVLRYDKVKFGRKGVKGIARDAADGNFDSVVEKISNMKGLNSKEKKELLGKLNPLIEKAKYHNDVMSNARKSMEDVNTDLSKTFGKDFKGDKKGLRWLFKALEAEQEGRSAFGPNEEEQTPEETLNTSIVNFNDIYKEKTDALINTISTSNHLLSRLLGDENPEDVLNPMEYASKKKYRKAKKKGQIDARHANKLNGKLNASNPYLNEDGKDATEARDEEEKAQTLEEARVEESKKTNTWLSRLYEKTFGKFKKNRSKSDDDENENKGGILSRLFGGFKKFSKFMGVGGKVALGVVGISLFGHATEWFKNKIWPVIKTGLFGKDGESGLLGGPLNKLKNWWQSGGLEKLLGEKLIPGFVNGLGYTMENVVAPAVALLIKHLPSILWGTVKGLFKGFKMAIIRKKVSDEASEKKQLLAEAHDLNSSSVGKEYRSMVNTKSRSLQRNMSPTMRRTVNAATAGNNYAYQNISLDAGGGSPSSGGNDSEYSSNRNTENYYKNNPATYADNSKGIDLASLDSSAVYDFGNDQNRAYVEKHKDQFGKNELETSTSPLTVTTKSPFGLLGRRKNTNIVRYDENGNVLTDYDRMNTHDSVLSRIARAGALSFRNSLVGGGNGLGGKIIGNIANSKMARIKLKDGIFKKTGKTLKNTIIGGARVVNTGQNLGNKVRDAIITNPSREASGLNKWFLDHGGEAAANFAESRNLANMAEEAVNPNSVKKMGKASKWLNDKIKEKFRNSGSKTLNNIAAESGEGAVASGAKNLIKNKATKVGSAIVDNAKNSSGLIGKISGFITKIFTKLSNTKLVRVLKKYGPKTLTTEGSKKLIIELGEKLSNALIKKGLKNIGKKAAEFAAQLAALCAFPIAKVATWIADFIWGYRNAHSLLGLAKEADFNVTTALKVTSGLIHMIWNMIPMVSMFISTEDIIQPIIELLAPVFGFTKEAYKDARDQSSEILDEWNKEHKDDPTQQYDNMEDYNKRNSWWSKTKRWFSKKFLGKGKTSDEKLVRNYNKIQIEDSNSNKSFKYSNSYGTGKFGYGKISQLDPKIARMNYNGHNIAQAGCAPVAMTNLINNIKGNENLNVATAAAYAMNNGFKPSDDGTDPRYMNSILDASGIDNQNVSGEGIDKSLKYGNPVAIMGKGNNSRSPYGTSSPHYITAMGYDIDGNIIVDDPYEKGYSKYKKSDVLNGVMSAVSAKRRRRNGRRGFGKANPFDFSDFMGVKTNTQTPVTKTLTPQYNVKMENAYTTSTTADVIVHEDLGSWSEITADQMNKWIRSKAPSNSTFIGNGGVFIQAAKESGLNPRYILAHAALESAWGTSKIAKDKNNYFGIGAFDSSPYSSAYSFDSGLAAGIIGGAKWIAKNYYFSSYNQNSIYKMRFNNGVHQYATDTGWAGKIANIMATCPYPNTKSVPASADPSYNAASYSDGSSSTNNGGQTKGKATTLVDALSDLGVSMVKAAFGREAFEALFGKNDESDSTNGIDPNSPNGGTLGSSSISTGSIAEFLNTAAGKDAIEYGSGSGTQCVELPNWYSDKIIGTGRGPAGHGDGKEYAANISNEYPNLFSFHNPSSEAPKAGDIISLQGSKTQYGHAAIVKSTNSNGNISVLEQWKGSGKIKENSFKYPGTGTRHILGIARPNITTIDPNATINNTPYIGQDQYNSYFALPVKSSSSTFIAPQNVRSPEAAKKVQENYNNSSSTFIAPQNVRSPEAIKKLQEAYNNNSTKYGYGKSGGMGSAETGTATSALNANRYNSSNNILANMNNSNVNSVDYQTFLKTIVSILMNINDNTALLSRIIQILSDNFNIKIDKSDIDAAHTKSKAEAEKQLNDLVRKSSNNIVGTSKLLNNKDTDYIIQAMKALASE